MKNEKMMECQQYFKSRPIFEKLFRKMRDKYYSLGHMGGSVILTGLSSEDKQHLGGFMQRDYTKQKSVTISSVRFEQALSESRFGEFTCVEVLEEYFGESLIAKKEVARLEQERRQVFFAEMTTHAGEGIAKDWFQSLLLNKREGYQLLIQQFHLRPEVLRDTMLYVFQAISMLPILKQQTEALAVFAAAVTDDPHYFDEGTLGEKLLTSFLNYQYSDIDTFSQSRAEKQKNLFFCGGIIKDDLSNYTLAYGIHALQNNGELHWGIGGFFELKEPVQLTLYTLGRLRSVWGGVRQDVMPEGLVPVYVIENPAVFAAVIKKHPDVTAICSNGQPRLATLLLMDLLDKTSTFYYSGDFDPEGLLIAQRLKLRYGRSLEFWNYEPELYQSHLSDVVLSEKRLQILRSVYIEELQSIKALMREEKRAAYQEAMLEAF